MQVSSKKVSCSVNRQDLPDWVIMKYTERRFTIRFDRGDHKVLNDDEVVNVEPFVHAHYWSDWRTPHSDSKHSGPLHTRLRFEGNEDCNMHLHIYVIISRTSLVFRLLALMHVNRR